MKNPGEDTGTTLGIEVEASFLYLWWILLKILKYRSVYLIESIISENPERVMRKSLSLSFTYYAISHTYYL